MAVEIGQEAPDFELTDSEGGRTKLSEFRGKKNVLLVFYPLAFSRGCQSEFCTLRDENADLATGEDVEVIGVSVDSPFTLKAWKEKEQFPNRFVADFWPHGEVSQRYGVFVDGAGVATRGTFLIDTEGIVRWKETNEIGELRDQDGWRKALTDL